MKKPKQYKYIKETNIEFKDTEGCIIIIKKYDFFSRNKQP